ncbi:MAG: hypothetical protein MJ214_05100 [Bacilli bacterium]|nr:hypothetical protein [Bacilli bacterium]
MKKLGLLITPIMAVSLLTGCSCSNNPQPEPPVITYTVVLNASDGASFSNGQHTIFLNNVPEGTPLNESVGYALPIHEQLDFNYWYDEHGNVVKVNTPIYSNLILTSKFYHGPEFVRNYVYNTIYDELWNDINNPIWVSAFSDSQLTSFTDVTYQALFDKRLSSVDAIDGFKKLYDFARYEMFTHRDNQETVDLIFNKYQDTIKDAFSLIGDTNKVSAYVNLSYANFIIQCYLIINPSHLAGITQYAYQQLINFINSLSDSVDLIETWDYIIPNLLLTSYYMGDDTSAFDYLVATAKKDVQSLLDNECYNVHDVKELAKVYGNYYLAVSRDNTLNGSLDVLVQYIIDNYFSKDAKVKLISNLCRQYLVACASEMSSEVDINNVLYVGAKFKNRIEGVYSDFPAHAQRYYSIAMLFAEAIRKNPEGNSYVSSIVESFMNNKITSEDESWDPQMPYLYYIDSFAAVAEAMSQFDPFIILENNEDPSYSMYVKNVEVIFGIINEIITSEKVTKEEDFAPIPILTRHIAKISNYTIEAYNPTSSVVCNWIINGIINPATLPSDISNFFPLWFTVLLPIELDNAIINCAVNDALKKGDLPEDQFFKIIYSYKSMAIRGDGYEKYFSLIPIISEFLSKWCLGPCYAAGDMIWKDIYSQLVTQLEEYEKLFTNVVLLHTMSLVTLTAALSQSALYRGFNKKDNPPDRIRMSSVLVTFLSGRIRKIAGREDPKIFGNIDAAYNCIIKVLLCDYIPNITDDITEADRLKLEKAIDDKIKTLIENY